MGNWVKRTAIILMCVAMAFSAAACNSKQKEKEEAEKAKQEQIKQENEAAANAFIGAVEALPKSDELKLKDETEVAGARELYDALTDEQKELVPSEKVTLLEEAERKIEELKEKKAERDAEKKENKKAAKQAEDVINGIPDNVTLDAENAVIQARAEYNQLTDDQKKFVSQKAIDKLTNAEGKIVELKEAQKKAEEETAKKEEEKKKKAAEKKKSSKKNDKKKDSGKKEEKKQDKYSIAKKYVGKKASALIAAIGKPNKKKKNANCATDGEEYIYYYDGFYVGVLSQDMDSPLIVQNVTKN